MCQSEIKDQLNPTLFTVYSIHTVHGMSRLVWSIRPLRSFALTTSHHITSHNIVHTDDDTKKRYIKEKGIYNFFTQSLNHIKMSSLIAFPTISRLGTYSESNIQSTNHRHTHTHRTSCTCEHKNTSHRNELAIGLVNGIKSQFIKADFQKI